MTTPPAERAPRDAASITPTQATADHRGTGLGEQPADRLGVVEQLALADRRADHGDLGTLVMARPACGFASP